MQQVGKYIVIAGIIIVLIGLILWRWGHKLQFLGRLPGDIHIRRENFSFYFPITTMILVSIVVSAIIWLIRKIN